MEILVIDKKKLSENGKIDIFQAILSRKPLVIGASSVQKREN